MASAPVLASHVSLAKLLPNPGPLFSYLKLFDQIISRVFVPILRSSMTFSCLFLIWNPSAVVPKWKDTSFLLIHLSSVHYLKWGKSKVSQELCPVYFLDTRTQLAFCWGQSQPDIKAMLI